MVIGYLVRVSKRSVATKRGIPCTKTVLPTNKLINVKKLNLYVFSKYILAYTGTVPYCPARWIRPRLVSLDRHLLRERRGGY
jgi:hypothetical protein